MRGFLRSITNTHFYTELMNNQYPLIREMPLISLLLSPAHTPLSLVPSLHLSLPYFSHRHTHSLTLSALSLTILLSLIPKISSLPHSHTLSILSSSPFLRCRRQASHAQAASEQHRSHFHLLYHPSNLLLFTPLSHTPLSHLLLHPHS